MSLQNSRVLAFSPVSCVSVIGLPSSAGSYAAGQDQAPGALRSAGLMDALALAGLEVHDHGDLPRQVWHPDHEDRLAQNVDEVIEGLEGLASRIVPILEVGDILLVLGGNCTIALSVMVGLRQMGAGPPALLYVDGDYDLNAPESTTDGALDWMGMAHALALPGAIERFVEALGERPLLQAYQVGWLGVHQERATAWEPNQVNGLGLNWKSSEDFVSDPVGAVRSVLDVLPSGPLAIHLDVDVLDFIDAPIAENTDGRNTGPTLAQATEALSWAARDSRFRALSIGELNPTRCAGDPTVLPRFCSAIARILSR